MQFFKKPVFYIIISSLLFIFVGAVFFLIQRDWLIIQWTLGGSGNSEEVATSIVSDVALRKKVKLYYFKDDKFLYEYSIFVWFSNKVEDLKHLINNWLSFLHEERILEKKVGLETVCFAPSNSQVYFSFDQPLFDKQWPTFKKWYLIESMFKTIKDAGLQIGSVNFLVGHEEMKDDHLDFSQAWPVDGFLEESLFF